LSSARNAGIEKAVGDYLSFIDGDDWLELNMYETMVRALRETGSDFVTCDAYFCKNSSPHKDTISKNTGLYSIIQDNEDLFTHILEPAPLIRFEVWNKLYKKTSIADIRFKVGQRYEDIYFDRMVLQKVKQCVSIDSALYNYRLNRPGGTNSSFKKDRLSKLYEIDEYILDFKKRGRVELAKRYQRYAADSAIDLYRLAQINGGIEDVKQILYDKFEIYYKENGYRTLRHILFHTSPWAYGVIANLLKFAR